MKTLKHLLLFAAFPASFFGQSIQLTNMNNGQNIAPNAVIMATVNAEAHLLISIDIKNTSTATKNYIVKRYDMHLNRQGLAYFCVGGSCFNNATIVSPPVQLNGGQKTS